jgi:hypothetical protein
MLAPCSADIVLGAGLQVYESGAPASDMATGRGCREVVIDKLMNNLTKRVPATKETFECITPKDGGFWPCCFVQARCGQSIIMDAGTVHSGGPGPRASDSPQLWMLGAHAYSAGHMPPSQVASDVTNPPAEDFILWAGLNPTQYFENDECNLHLEREYGLKQLKRRVVASDKPKKKKNDSR